VIIKNNQLREMLVEARIAYALYLIPYASYLLKPGFSHKYKRA
jgi:hypothetical protein